MEPSIHIDRCRSEDVPALMKFIHDEWAKNHILSRDEALFRWQYAATGGVGAAADPTILVAWRRDRIVGMLGLTLMRWLQGGVSYKGAWSSHWYVVPEFRTSPLALLLIRHATQLGIEVIGTVGTSAADILRIRGYEVIPEIPRRVAIIDATQTAALLLASGIESRKADGIAFSGLAASPAPSRAAHRDWVVAEWSEEIGDEWDAHWESRIAPQFAGATRDSSFIRWRYLRHPSFQYRVWVACHCPSGEVRGLVVSRLETVKSRTEQVLRICDLLTDSVAATDCLVDHLMADARQRGVAFADFYCTKAIDGLSRAGFLTDHEASGAFSLPSRLQPLERGGRPLNAAIRLPDSLRGTIGELAARGELYLTKADGDQDRPN